MLSVALLRNLADFLTKMQFSREKPEHGNAPIERYSQAMIANSSAGNRDISDLARNVRLS